MEPEYEIRVHWGATDVPIVARMDPASVRALVRLMDAATGVPAATDDPWDLLAGLQAFYRAALAGDGSVVVAGADGGLWTIPVREVRAIRLGVVPAAAPASAGRPAVPAAFRDAFRDPGAPTPPDPGSPDA